MPRDGGNQTGMDGPSPALPSPCCGGRKEGEAGKGGLLGGGLDLEGRLTLRKAAGLGSGPPPVRITFTVDPRSRCPRQGEMDAGRGGGWAAEGPVCSHHGGRLKGGISTNSHF